MIKIIQLTLNDIILYAIFATLIIVVVILFLMKREKGKELKQLHRRTMSVYRDLMNARRRERLEYLIITNLAKSIMFKNVISASNTMLMGQVHNPHSTRNERSPTHRQNTEEEEKILELRDRNAL